MAVSPFDGVNRIRFKGSLNIADLRLPIEFNAQICNRQLAVTNAQTLSRQCGSPETYLIFKLSEGF
jgi:hypothetical protein